MPDRDTINLDPCNHACPPKRALSALLTPVHHAGHRYIGDTVTVEHGMWYRGMWHGVQYSHMPHATILTPFSLYLASI